MALKAAMKKLASMRQSASAGSLTVKSLSMCLACNRPIYQSDDTVKHSQNTRLGPANHSIMAERHRQQGVYKLDPQSTSHSSINSRSTNSSGGFYRDRAERPQSVPMEQPNVNMSGSRSQASIVMPVRRQSPSHASHTHTSPTHRRCSARNQDMADFKRAG
jgi:hypothetical protein